MKKGILLFLVAGILIFFNPIAVTAGDKLHITFPTDAKHVALVKEEGQKHILITVTTKDNKCLQFKMLGAKFVAFKTCSNKEWNTNVVVD